MHRREAYAVLGLEPPNIFMSEQPANAQRRIGASTTMLVEAALTLMGGQDVHIRGRSLTHATSLHSTCMSYYDKLHTVVHDQRPSIVSQKPRLVRYGPHDVMLLSGSPSSDRQRPLFRTRDFVLFDDRHWHRRAEKRMRDPVSRIRFLRYDLRGWHAFDVEGAYIALLTRACGDRLLREYPTHILIADM